MGLQSLTRTVNQRDRAVGLGAPKSMRQMEECDSGNDDYDGNFFTSTIRRGTPSPFARARAEFQNWQPLCLGKTMLLRGLTRHAQASPPSSSPSFPLQSPQNGRDLPLGPQKERPPQSPEDLKMTVPWDRCASTRLARRSGGGGGHLKATEEACKIGWPRFGSGSVK